MEKIQGWKKWVIGSGIGMALSNSTEIFNKIKGNEIGRGDTGYESMYKEDCGNTCGADSLVVLSHARRIRFLRNLFCGKLWSS